ncbi:transcriptional regulator, PadR family, partial [human gut metagenome]
MAIDRNLVQGSMAMMILRLLETKDMYGYEMIEALRERSNNVFELKAGTLYPLLHSLESRGDVVSYEDNTSGKTRKYYQLTPAGKKQCGRKEEGMAGIPDCSFRSVESS